MKCPRCGKGLSAKYRVPGVVHARRVKWWIWPKVAKPTCPFTF